MPKARSVGGEAEFSVSPTSHFDLDVTTGYTDAKLKSTVTSTAPDQTVNVVSGIHDGNRLPSVPEFQLAAAATYRWQLSGSWLGYVTGSYQHVGSRYTQVGDEEPGFGVVNLLSFGKNTIGAPLTQSSFSFDPLLPAYDILNLRLGFVKRNWEVALFGNNLTDERALLALDRERGLRARVGYLSNQPRTFGVSVYVTF